MSIQLHNDDALDFEEFLAEEEVMKLEEEVQLMAEQILEYRTVLPDQLSSTLSSLLASRRPVLSTNIVDEGYPEPDSEAGVSQGLERSMESKSRGTEKILLNQKILRNALMFRIVLMRMEECIGRMNKLASSDGIIHPALKRKCTS